MRKPLIGSLILLILFLSFLPFLGLEEMSAGAIEIPPPTKHKDLGELVDAIVKFLMELALLVVPIVIVVAGYFFVTAAGDPQKITTAKNIIIYAAIGLLIVLSAGAISALIKAVVTGGEEPTGWKDILNRVINWLFYILLFFAAVMIVVSGYFFVTAAGDPETAKKARAIIVYAVIGIVVAFVARGVVTIITRMVGTSAP